MQLEYKYISIICTNHKYVPNISIDDSKPNTESAVKLLSHRMPTGHYHCLQQYPLHSNHLHRRHHLRAKPTLVANAVAADAWATFEVERAVADASDSARIRSNVDSPHWSKATTDADFETLDAVEAVAAGAVARAELASV